MVLSGTAAIMIISLMIRRLAYALRSSSAILYQISPSVKESAISPGDSPLKAFVTVTAKLMLPGVISGAILIWITLINELSSSVMLYTANTRTMSVAIYNEVIPRQLWHGRRAGHHPYADDGAVAVPVFQDQRKQGCRHVAFHLSQAGAYA